MTGSFVLKVLRLSNIASNSVHTCREPALIETLTSYLAVLVCTMKTGNDP